MKYNTNNPLNIAAVIVCAGKGERSGLAYNKILHLIGHKTVLEKSLDTFLLTRVKHITVVTSEGDISAVRDVTSAYDDISVVVGGDTRAKSVYAGLQAYPCDIVLIHDGARPYVTTDIIERAIDSAIEHGSGIAAVACVDTVKRVQGGKAHSLPRAELFNAQTPQAFRYADIIDAYSRADGVFTDDAEVYENAGYTPRLVEGSYDNKKLTTPADFIAPAKSSRIGIGFDLHRLVEGRKLILGGVTLDYHLGLLGHSDADVLTHAIMDALLSAADLPDIGVLFPDTDDKYLGISSITLLKQVLGEVQRKGYVIGNISAVVIAQQPKLATVIADIRRSLADALNIEVTQINVSATTTEKLGLIGEGNAIAANASCILNASSTFTENTDGKD
ncbi:MAG: 2-C-methyl-D-erythritol 4-phosphate cytidylyltransferase [Clostridiales bacterium]|nr:2-C-methyl-D-erythritol 4-phosphate cytidylyltransferase [Clostridiales bacterium]